MGGFSESLFQEEGQYGTSPIRESFGSSKARVSCQNRIPPLQIRSCRFGVQIVTFASLKNASKIADIGPSEEGSCGLYAGGFHKSLLNDKNLRSVLLIAISNVKKRRDGHC